MRTAQALTDETFAALGAGQVQRQIAAAGVDECLLRDARELVVEYGKGSARTRTATAACESALTIYSFGKAC